MKKPAFGFPFGSLTIALLVLFMGWSSSGMAAAPEHNLPSTRAAEDNSVLPSSKTSQIDSEFGPGVDLERLPVPPNSTVEMTEAQGSKSQPWASTMLAKDNNHGWELNGVRVGDADATETMRKVDPSVSKTTYNSSDYRGGSLPLGEQFMLVNDQRRLLQTRCREGHKLCEGSCIPQSNSCCPQGNGFSCDSSRYCCKDRGGQYCAPTKACCRSGTKACYKSSGGHTCIEQTHVCCSDGRSCPLGQHCCSGGIYCAPTKACCPPRTKACYKSSGGHTCIEQSLVCCSDGSGCPSGKHCCKYPSGGIYCAPTTACCRSGYKDCRGRCISQSASC